MTDTVFVRGAGGTIFEMDVPTLPHAAERWQQALAKGDLVVVPHAEWVERSDGSRYLVEAAKPADEAPNDGNEAKSRKGRKAAADDADEAPNEE